MASRNNTDRRRFIYDSLMKLSERSPLIQITPLEVKPGWPPDKYQIDYRCRSITGIEVDGQPIFGENHRMKIYLDRDYPRTEPHMTFVTPIWHPNISSEEPRQVCTDKAKTWWVGKEIADLVIQVGEMLQYKHYHALNEPPFPQDSTVAAWVLNYAEPQGLLGPKKPVDRRSLLKSHRIRQNNEQKMESRIKLGVPVQNSAENDYFVCPGCGLQTHHSNIKMVKGGRS